MILPHTCNVPSTDFEILFVNVSDKLNEEGSDIVTIFVLNIKKQQSALISWDIIIIVPAVLLFNMQIPTKVIINAGEALAVQKSNATAFFLLIIPSLYSVQTEAVPFG